jgi:SPW repeat
MLTRMIPTQVHAAMDYTVGLLLIAAPWVFGFADESTTATWISVLAGVAIIGLSAMTDYEGGFLSRVIPMRGHLATDALLGIVLAASPWLFGFADQGTNAWLPFVVIGLGEILAAATTDPEPEPRRRAAAHT